MYLPNSLITFPAFNDLKIAINAFEILESACTIMVFILLHYYFTKLNNINNVLMQKPLQLSFPAHL